MATKFLLVLAAALLSAPAAMAEIEAPHAYTELTAPAPMHPGKAPRLVNGMSDLSSREDSHRERLPMQLERAMAKIKKAKYAPKRRKAQQLSDAPAAIHTAKASHHSGKGLQKSRVRTVYVGSPAKSFEENLPMPSSKPAAAPSARFENEAL